MALTLALLAGAGAACDKRGGDPKPSPPGSSFAVAHLTIDSAQSPRGDAPLIAGDRARIGVMIRDGIGPYHIQLGSERIATDGSPAGPALLEGASTIEAGANAEIAFETTLQKQALSGQHRIWISVRNARGKTQSAGATVSIIGADAPVWADGEGSQGVKVLDLLGRRRKQLVRGEPFTLHIAPQKPGPYTITMSDSKGRVLAAVDRKNPTGGAATLNLSVPRLARPGRYTITAGARNGAEAPSATFEVIGEPFPRVSKLVIDSLTLYGGKDRRAPRKGLLRLGEPLVIEARVGGAKSAVSGRLMILSQKGKKLIDVGISEAKVSDRAPDARIFVHGEVMIPRGAPFRPDRYRIQVEVNEGDDVSMRTREVLIE